MSAPEPDPKPPFRIDWNDERVAVLKRMWAEGHSAGNIALHLKGVTRNAVTGKLNRLGLLGSTARAPSRPVRLPRPAPARAAPRNGWTADEERVLQQARERGDTYRLIAERLGRSENACKVKAQKMGLVVKGPAKGGVSPTGEVKAPRTEPTAEPSPELYGDHAAWSVEDTETLRQLWQDGHSAGDIGRELGRTRNAVMNKLYRVGLLGKGAAVRQNPSAPALLPPVPAPEPETRSGPDTHDERPRRGCQYPLNDPPRGGEYQFCGDKVKGGSSYCPAHHALCRVTPKIPMRAPREARVRRVW